MSAIRPKCDYTRVNKTRRSRGYNFEHNIVQAFNNTKEDCWHAKRLGGSSTGLPDIIATNTQLGTVISIECKSSATDAVYIPRDQLDRCNDIIDNFLDYYPNRFIVLACKFKANKSKNRKLQYYFMVTTSIIYPDNLKGIKITRNKIIPSFYKPDTVEDSFGMSIYLENYSSITNFINVLTTQIQTQNDNLQ